jgi:hypothetical protein
MKNKIEDLRNHLFAALEGLADKDAPLDLDRARTIASVAQTIINSAKVEVDFFAACGRLPDGGLLRDPNQKQLTS